MDQAAHAAKLHYLCPSGPAWDGEDFYALLTACAGAAARGDDLSEQLITDFLPDSAAVTGALIDDWARVLGLPEAYESDAWDGYSDAQKAAVIIAKLNGRSDPNLPNLQAVFEDLFDDAAVELTQLEHPAFVAGLGAAGDLIGAAWVFVWTLRYMDNVLNATPNAFDTWDDTAAVSANAATSPISGTAVADLVTGTLVIGQYRAGTSIDNTADGDELRFSIWLRGSAPGQSCVVRFIQRDGSTITGAVTVPLKDDLWQKVVIAGSAGAGGSAPEVQLVWTTASQIYMADAYAGIRAPELELRAQTLAPIHTTGEFLTKGEDQ